MFLAFTAVAAVLALSALAPVRKEPYAVVTFLCAWVVGELPVHAAVVVVAGVAALGGPISPRGPVWWLALALGVAATAGYVVLAVSAHRSADLVDRGARHGSRRPRRPPRAWTCRPAWLSWWRLVVAVPFRLGRIRRIRNIDYQGDGLYRHKLDVLVRRSDPPSGAPVLVYIHGGAWIIGDKREQGIPMMHELVQRGLGVRGHQLPAEPEGHVARPHRRLQAGPRLGARPHRTSTAATPPSSPCRAARPAATSRRWPH